MSRTQSAEVVHSLDLLALWGVHASSDHRVVHSDHNVQRAIFLSVGQTVYAHPNAERAL